MGEKNEYREHEGELRAVGFRDEKGQLYLQRCPQCWRENYAIAVAAGQCAWCGWTDEEKQKDEGE